MKLNVSKTKTMLISRSHTMHPVTPVNYWRNCADDLVILGVTIDSKMIFEKHLCLVSRATSQRLGILRKSWRVFHYRCLWFFVLPVMEHCSTVWCSAAYSLRKLLDCVFSGARFLTGACRSVTLLIVDL